MYKILNKQMASTNEGQDPVRYADIIAHALEHRTPEGGYTPKQMERRADVIVLVEKQRERASLRLENADYDYILEVVNRPGWSFNRELNEMLKVFTKAQPINEDVEEALEEVADEAVAAAS